MITLAVDCMGGDHGPRVTLAACRHFLEQHADARLLLVGKPEALTGLVHERAEVLAASEVVSMDDTVEVALRKKKDSSMRVAIQQVKDGRADVAVSAGNTGALMAIARYLLKTLDGIDRPAIAALMPNIKGQATTVLDLGANVDCTAEHLLQFAVMGSALVSVLKDEAHPSVGLLNIGEEVIKGNDTIKKAGELLRSALSSGDLKFSRSIFRKIAAICAYPVLSSLKKRMDYRRYNGAALLGLRGLVFKSHGSADEFAFEQALNRAYDAARNNLLDRVKVRIARAAPLLAVVPGEAGAVAAGSSAQ